jgi:ABC-type Fe3+/spermidine/putrescine transport system ATPase subunit
MAWAERGKMIELRDLSKRFGRTWAVRKLSLRVEGGEKLVIRGPSGSGKTTLLRLIAGLEMPDEGEIFIDGQKTRDGRKVMPPYRRGVGFVFQRNALWPHMTVVQNMQFAMNGLEPAEAARRLEELLHDLQLEHLRDRYPAQLSGGEARRVALARALAARPKRLLLDEPLTNMDPDLKQQIMNLIQTKIMHPGLTVIYVTHDQGEQQWMNGRLIKIRDGQIV